MYLRTHASQLVEEAKLKGTTNVEHESPTSEVNPILEIKPQSTPPEFKKNPFTLKTVKLKPLPSTNFLKEEKPKEEPKCRLR